MTARLREPEQQWLEGVYYYPVVTEPGNNPGLILSCGIHGNETTPIICLNQLRQKIQKQQLRVQRPVLLVFANLDAIDQGRRFIQHNMNRLFNLDVAPGSTLLTSAEYQRARQLEGCCERFSCLIQGTKPLIHLDLHSTIKPSLHPVFVLQPGQTGQYQSPLWQQLISHAKVSGWVVQTKPAHTFSQFSLNTLNAESVTLEMGHLGSEQQHNLLPVLESFISAGSSSNNVTAVGDTCRKLASYRVYGQIIKHSDSFEFLIDETLANFSLVKKGHPIYKDQGNIVSAEQALACLFLNSKVAIGQRAGLLLKAI